MFVSFPSWQLYLLPDLRGRTDALSDLGCADDELVSFSLISCRRRASYTVRLCSLLRYIQLCSNLHLPGKATTYWTESNIVDGLNALATTIEVRCILSLLLGLVVESLIIVDGLIRMWVCGMPEGFR